MNEKIDGLIADINQGIGEASQLIAENNVPEFSLLESKIVEFSKEVKTLPNIEAKQYTTLLETWTGEIKKIHDHIGDIRQEVADQLSEANSGGNASNAYGSANNLVE